MTYGEHLSAAADALAHAHTALRDPPPDPGQRACAAQSRIAIYRSLEQHIVVLGPVEPGELPPADRITADTDPHTPRQSLATKMAISLRRAAAGSVAATAETPGRYPPTTPVAIALDGAQSHLWAATDILVSNVGPADRSPLRHRPLTPDGLAVLAGVGRGESLALLARLIIGMVDLDRRLARWLWSEEAPRSMRPLLDAAELDTWRTRTGTLRGTAILLSAKAHPDQSPLIGMTVAPAVDDPQRWQAVTTLRGCVDAVDAARSWLLRHGDHLTADQLAHIARTTAALVHLAGHAHIHTGSGGGTTDHLASAALAWRHAAHATTGLRSAVHDHAEATTATVALAAATRTLHDQLRPHGDWRNPPPWAGNQTATTRWSQTAHDLLARLPDLADLTLAALNRSRQAGNILTPTGTLIANDTPVHRGQWKPADPKSDAYQTVHTALQTAARATRQLAETTDVTPRPGLGAAAASRTCSGITAAHLASQWYPRTHLPNHNKQPTAHTRRNADPQRQTPRRTR